jgi:hypothetical protein
LNPDCWEFREFNAWVDRAEGNVLLDAMVLFWKEETRGFKEEVEAKLEREFDLVLVPEFVLVNWELEEGRFKEEFPKED